MKQWHTAQYKNNDLFFINAMKTIKNYHTESDKNTRWWIESANCIVLSWKQHKEI